MKPETKIRKDIEKYLRSQGWYVRHVQDRYFIGELDLYCIRAGFTIWIEVKTLSGKLSVSQAKEIIKKLDHGANVFLVRSIFAVEEINRIFDDPINELKRLYYREYTYRIAEKVIYEAKEKVT